MRYHEPEATLAPSGAVDALRLACVNKLIGRGSTESLSSQSIYTDNLTAALSFTSVAPEAYAACHDGVYKGPSAPSQHDRLVKLRDDHNAALVPHDTTSASVLVLHRHSNTDDARLWLSVRPSRAEYMMRKSEWQSAARLRLLMPPLNDPHPSCVCGQACSWDKFVVHALDCKHVTGYTRTNRHNLIRDTFKKVLRTHGFTPETKEPRLFDGCTTGPDILFQVGSEFVLIDVSVVNPLAPSYVEHEARFPNYVFDLKERDKNNKYAESAKARNMEFHPFVLSVFGLASPNAKALIKRLSGYCADPKGFVDHMWMAMGVAVQIGNAKLLCSACKSTALAGLR
jgi:hypothetical protein